MDSDRAGQVVSVIEEQEKLLQFNGFSADDAWTIGNILRSTYLSKYAKLDNGVVISIELFSGDVLFRTTVGDKTKATPVNWSWAAGKGRSVRAWSRPSLFLGRSVLAAGKTFGRFGPQPPGVDGGEESAGVHVQHGGGFPIWVKGVTVGPIGVILVSGLPEEQDHQLIVDSLADFLKITNVPNVLEVQ